MKLVPKITNTSRPNIGLKYRPLTTHLIRMRGRGDNTVSPELYWFSVSSGSELGVCLTTFIFSKKYTFHSILSFGFITRRRRRSATFYLFVWISCSVLLFLCFVAKKIRANNQLRKISKSKRNKLNANSFNGQMLC